MSRASLGLALLLMGALVCAAHAQTRVSEVDLVSDVPGRAVFTDAHLVNPWGIAIPPSGNIWVSDNATGFATIYNEVDGTPRSLVVSIPPSDGTGKPTGQVVGNVPGAFMVSNGDTSAPALFIFASENGTISGWNPGVDGTHAIQEVSTDGAIYKGIALVHMTPGGPRLYAADFHHNRIDVFDGNWASVTPSGGFTDPNLPAGFAPFNVANIGGQLYVSFAQQDADSEDDAPGAGLGFVDVFDIDGHLQRRFASQGALNAPWGMVQAPPGFGGLGGDILIGNFGDGALNAFDRATGAPLGAVQDSLGHPLVIDGLWGLAFGVPLMQGPPGLPLRLFFTAGPAEESHGLFGYFTAPQPPPPSQACVNAPQSLGAWRHLCGGPIPHHDDGHEGDDDGGGHGHHGPPAGNPDSLTALFACISGQSHAFGASGCFTAGCELLQQVGRMTQRQRVAAQFLTLDLNRCAGVLCDSTTLRCFDAEDDDAGDGGPGVAPAMTVGELAAALDSALCAGGGDHDRGLARLGALAACANGGDEDGGTSDDSGDQATRSGIARIAIQPLGSNPHPLSGGAMAFRLTATSPALVRFAIYDAAGRLVAEPLHLGPVTGQRDVSWDGRDAHGRLVSPGTYFYRASAADARAGGRLVIVR
ncbi:MAG TPA: TIGR03118 family protein [Candidatus Eisenbacteria bacterium]|nr:TIGR03118 family protein [Candidatus Eisenbacteria bacterium]